MRPFLTGTPPGVGNGLHSEVPAVGNVLPTFALFPLPAAVGAGRGSAGTLIAPFSNFPSVCFLLCERRRTMADTKGKIKDAIDKTADKAKDAIDKTVDKTKELAKDAGQKTKEMGQKMKDAAS
jgi:hypothetical protein